MTRERYPEIGSVHVLDEPAYPNLRVRGGPRRVKVIGVQVSPDARRNGELIVKFCEMEAGSVWREELLSYWNAHLVAAPIVPTDDGTDPVEALRAEIKFLRDREAHIGALLAVADGGRYRNDWGGAIERLAETARREERAACVAIARANCDRLASDGEEAAFIASAIEREILERNK